MIDFEAIYAALWAAVSTAAGFKESSRRLKHWVDVDADHHPALFMAARGINISQQKGIPAKVELTADLYIYAYSSNPDIAPSQLLNPLIKAVCDTIAPDYNGVQTLGLQDVSHVWVEGKIETDEGVLGDQAVAIIPIRILAV